MAKTKGGAPKIQSPSHTRTPGASVGAIRTPNSASTSTMGSKSGKKPGC